MKELSTQNVASGLGLRIVTNPMLVDGPFEDWSQVRSCGRAKRRRAQGHKQRIRLYYKPSSKVYRMGDTVVCHSTMYAEIQRQVHGNYA